MIGLVSILLSAQYLIAAFNLSGFGFLNTMGRQKAI
jgi:hypothetical protein